MLQPFFRFLIVGVINTLVGLSIIYILLHIAGLSFWLATFIGNSIGAVVSYTLNKTFTFKSSATVSKSAIRFIFAILACYFISYYLGKQLANWALDQVPFLPNNYKTDIAVLFGTGLYTITNYFGQKIIVFSK